MRVREYWPPGVVRYDPHEIFDALPDETKNRIEIADFCNVLETLEGFHLRYAAKTRAKDTARYLREIDELRGPEDES